MAREPEQARIAPPRVKKSVADKMLVAIMILMGGIGFMCAAGSLTLMWHAYLWFQGSCR